MFGWKISLILRNIGFDKLFKLLGRILSVNCWFIKLYCMPSRILLRNHWPNCSNGGLSSWKVFGCLSNRVFELFCRLLFR